jgi:hypothetical protein
LTALVKQQPAFLLLLLLLSRISLQLLLPAVVCLSSKAATTLQRQATQQLAAGPMSAHRGVRSCSSKANHKASKKIVVGWKAC